MTDRELMQMAIDALEQPSPIGGFNNQEYVAKALRDRLEQPEWVGLTEEETIDLLPVGEWEVESTLVFAKAIEDRLKDMNT